MEQLIEFDQTITQFLNRLLPHNYFFDYFFSFFSMKGSAIVIWILVIIFVVIFEEKKHPGISKNDKKFVIIFMTAFLTTSLLVEFPLKSFFRRQRPFTTIYNHLQLVTTNFNCPSDFSFPSGHASTAFAAAAVLAYFDKKRRYFYYLIASLIAFSRIYLGCHYFLDIIAGSIIGFITAKTAIKLIGSKK
jgi:undecaprenyl-diphosphatase